MVSVSTSPALHPTQNTHEVYRITSSMCEEQVNKELDPFHIKCIIDHIHVIF